MNRCYGISFFLFVIHDTWNSHFVGKKSRLCIDFVVLISHREAFKRYMYSIQMNEANEIWVLIAYAQTFLLTSMLAKPAESILCLYASSEDTDLSSGYPKT